MEAMEQTELTIEQVVRSLGQEARSYTDLMRLAQQRYGIKIDFYTVKSFEQEGLISKEQMNINNLAKKDSEMFIYGKNFTSSMRKRVIEIRGNCCESCGVSTQWEDGRIALQVHHIDGNRKNNQLDNLMVLCPNCHALTDNYGVKNILTSVDEEMIRNLYELEQDIFRVIEIAELPLNNNTVQIVKHAIFGDTADDEDCVELMEK